MESKIFRIRSELVKLFQKLISGAGCCCINPVVTRAFFRVLAGVAPEDGFGRTPAQQCPCQGPNSPLSTSHHLVWECPRFSTSRRKFLSDLSCWDDVFSNSHLSSVISFLMDTGIGFSLKELKEQSSSGDLLVGDTSAAGLLQDLDI